MRPFSPSLGSARLTLVVAVVLATTALVAACAGLPRLPGRAAAGQGEAAALSSLPLKVTTAQAGLTAITVEAM